MAEETPEELGIKIATAKLAKLIELRDKNDDEIINNELDTTLRSAVNAKIVEEIAIEEAKLK